MNGGLWGSKVDAEYVSFKIYPFLVKDIIVYKELLSRGYDVKAGNLENGEIDFIATRFIHKNVIDWLLEEY